MQRSLIVSRVATGSVFAVALCLSHNADAASISVVQRTSTQTVSFADTAAFTDASVAGVTDLQLSAATAGDTLALGYTVPHGATGFNVSSLSPDFNVSAPVLSIGSPNDTQSFTVTAVNSPSNGPVEISSNLALNAAPSGADATLSAGIDGGYYFLEGTYDPTARQTTNASFFYELILDGNYSGVGNSTGDHQILSLNSGWTVDTNFVFDGTHTIFMAHKNAYAPQTDQINFSYQIFGAAVPVPLPPSFLVLCSGLMGLTALRRSSLRPVQRGFPAWRSARH